MDFECVHIDHDSSAQRSDGPLSLIVFWYLLSTNNHFQLYGSKSCLPEHNGPHGHRGRRDNNRKRSPPRIPRDKTTLSVSRIDDEKSKMKSPTYTKIDFQSKGETYYNTLCPTYIQKKKKRRCRNTREKKTRIKCWIEPSELRKAIIASDTSPIARTKTDEKNQIENSKYGTMRLPHRRHHHRRLSRSIEACSRVQWLFCVDLCVFIFITHYIVHIFFCSLSRRNTCFTKIIFQFSFCALCDPPIDVYLQCVPIDIEATNDVCCT